MRRKRKSLAEMSELECCQTLEKGYAESVRRQEWEERKRMAAALRTVRSEDGLSCPFVLCEGTLREAGKGKCVCDTCHRSPPKMSASRRALKIIGPTLRMFAALDEEMRLG